MNITKSLGLITACFALLFGATAAQAHEGMEHVMGTVATVSDTSVVVETVKHTKVTVLIDPATKFIHGDAPDSVKDLKVGDRVVVHAKQDKNHKLVAAEVKWGATKPDDMGDMKGMAHMH